MTVTLPTAPSGQVRLPDGRLLAWYQFGRADGTPVFYFHGFPGSGVEAAWGGALAERLGVRLLGVDRPGYGASSYAPGRTIRDWARDVEHLADHLRLSRFKVVGMSGGGPYALACAARLADRLAGVHVVSGFGPVATRGVERDMTALNRAGLLLGRRPWTAWILDAGRPVVHHVLTHHPNWIVRRLRGYGPPADGDALADLGPILEESFRRGVAHGTGGMVAEAKLFARFSGDWLGEVAVPVTWWHGERDRVVPVAMARRGAGLLPHCTTRFFPDDGHFSVVSRRLVEMLAPPGGGLSPPGDSGPTARR